MSSQSPKVFHAFVLILFAGLVAFLALSSWNESTPSMPGSHIPARPSVIAPQAVNVAPEATAPADMNALPGGVDSAQQTPELPSSVESLVEGSTPTSLETPPSGE